MKKKVVQYSIAEPCHESWSAMTPTEQGRFCQSCAKPVVDFTRMSDAQVLQFMSTTTGSVCGRMTSYQLNRDFTPYDTNAQTRSFSLRALVLGTALTTFSALHTHAQGAIKGKVAAMKGEVGVEQVNVPETHDSTVTRDSVFSGNVFDYIGNQYIAGATVTIFDEAGNELVTTLSNADGQFELPLLPEWEPFSAVIRKEEYEDRTYYFADLLTTRGVTVEINRPLELFLGFVIED